MPIWSVIAKIFIKKFHNTLIYIKSIANRSMKIFIERFFCNQWFGIFLSILAKASSSLSFSSHDLKVVAIVKPLIKWALAQLGKNYQTISNK